MKKYPDSERGRLARRTSDAVRSRKVRASRPRSENYCKNIPEPGRSFGFVPEQKEEIPG